MELPTQGRADYRRHWLRGPSHGPAPRAGKGVLRVRGLVRRPVELPDLERYLGDITDAAAVALAAMGAHVVVHCAALMHRATRREAVPGER